MTPVPDETVDLFHSLGADLPIGTVGTIELKSVDTDWRPSARWLFRKRTPVGYALTCVETHSVDARALWSEGYEYATAPWPCSKYGKSWRLRDVEFPE